MACWKMSRSANIMSTPDFAAGFPSGVAPETAQLEQTAAALAAARDAALIARMANAFFSGLPANPATSPGAALPSAPLFAVEPIYSAIPGAPAATPPLTPNHNPGSTALPFSDRRRGASVRPDLRGRSATRFGDTGITDIRCRCAVEPVGALGTGRDITGDPIARRTDRIALRWGNSARSGFRGVARASRHSVPIRSALRRWCSKPARRRRPAARPRCDPVVRGRVVLFSDRQPGGDRIP